MSNSPHILNVTADSFEKDVLERSFDLPVLVDFWAPWCGPCQTLGPVLEKVARAGDGAFLLAKVNTEVEQGLARHFQIQGIPAVKAIRDGQVVDQFTGLLPESAIQEFIERLLPSDSDKYAKDGEHHLYTGDLALAEKAFQAALAEDGDHPRALLGMGRIRMRTNAFEEAESFLIKVPAGAPEFVDAQTERSQVDLYRRLKDVIPQDEAEDILRADPSDGEAAYAMGVYLVAAGRYEDALEHLLMAVRVPSMGEQSREAMLDVFAVLGAQHELTRLYRSQLASLLH